MFLMVLRSNRVSPISIDAIEQFQVSVAPLMLNFLGAGGAISAITVQVQITSKVLPIFK
jgi:hypothetical protein